MTYLELVNDVLVRLREPTVTTVVLNSYSTLIGKFVNDAKRQIEDAFAWNVLGTTITVTTTASTASYATNAATASLIRTVVTGYPASHYLTFVDANNDTPIAESLYTDANINFNPSINRLEITGSLIVSGSGTFTGTQILSGSLIFALPTSPAFNGEIVRFGSGTLTTGQLYFLSSSGTWSLANANSTGSSTGMLGIATGTSPTANGLLVRGYAVSSSYTTSTGSIVYAATSSGLMTTTSPSSSNHVVRVVGYVTTIPNTIYFAPDPTFITLA